MTTARKTLIGAFVIGGSLLFALGMFWIGDRRLLFSESMELHTEFSNLSGLKVGAKTFVSGMDAGEVLGIQVPKRPGDKFRVQFRVLDKFRPLMRTDSMASIQVEGLVGSKVLQVESGTEAAQPIRSGATIPSREPVEIAQIIQQGVETINRVNAAIEEVQGRTVKTLDTVNELGVQAIKVTVSVGEDAGELFAAGKAIAKDVDTLVSHVREGRGTIGKLFTEERLYERASRVVDDVRAASQNARSASSDVKDIVADLKKRNVGEQIANTADNVQQTTAAARQLLTRLQSPPAGQRGLLQQVRTTLDNTREATADLSENLEALKRNWLFRGFFRERGFFDLDSISPADYAAGRFAPERGRERAWLDAAAVFTTTDTGEETLSEEGRKRIDTISTPYLRVAANTPLIIEGYSGTGTEQEQFLRSRERARMVRQYLIDRFDLKPTYVGSIAMGAVERSGPAGLLFEGLGIVYFPEKRGRR